LEGEDEVTSKGIGVVIVDNDVEDIEEDVRGREFPNKSLSLYTPKESNNLMISFLFDCAA
jgi:hypothetical protein